MGDAAHEGDPRFNKVQGPRSRSKHRDPPRLHAAKPWTVDPVDDSSLLAESRQEKLSQCTSHTSYSIPCTYLLWYSVVSVLLRTSTYG